MTLWIVFRVCSVIECTVFVKNMTSLFSYFFTNILCQLMWWKSVNARGISGDPLLLRSVPSTFSTCSVSFTCGWCTPPKFLTPELEVAPFAASTPCLCFRHFFWVHLFCLRGTTTMFSMFSALSATAASASALAPVFEN